jgi:hypothetical protein
VIFKSCLASSTCKLIELDRNLSTLTGISRNIFVYEHTAEYISLISKQ